MVEAITKLAWHGSGLAAELRPPEARLYVAQPCVPSSDGRLSACVCSRYASLVLTPLTPSYYCPPGTPPPYFLPWHGTQPCWDAASW